MTGFRLIQYGLLRTFAIPFYFLFSTFYSTPPPDNPAIKAEQAKVLIDRARLAIGGEDAICNIQSISVKGKVKRYVKYFSVRSPKSVEEIERTLSGKVELDFSFPDKFRRKYSTQVLRGYNYSYAEIVNGEEAWRNPPLRAISSNRDSRVIDVEDFERTTELQARGARQQITLYSLALLLQGIPGFPIQYSYLGLMETTSGEADVISVQGPENFQTFLLLEPGSSVPLAIAIAYIDALKPTVVVESSGFFDRRFMRATYQRARDERRRLAQPPRRNELQMQLSDYHQVGGILLPHRIKHLLNGELVEEVMFDEFRINQNINPKKFKGRPKPLY